MGFKSNRLLLSLGEVDNNQSHEDKKISTHPYPILSTKPIYKRYPSTREGDEGKHTKPLILIHLDTGKENLLELLQSCCKRFVLVFLFMIVFPIPLINVVSCMFILLHLV